VTVDTPEFLRFERPPDLQELVKRFGGFDKITPEAWAEYDAAVAKWQARRRANYLDLRHMRGRQ
jgi:hypothetical protein